MGRLLLTVLAGLAGLGFGAGALASPSTVQGLSWRLAAPMAPMAPIVAERAPAPFIGRLDTSLVLPAAPEPAGDVPPGFEDLAAAGGSLVEGELLVDVAVQGIAIGQASVFVVDGSVTFLAPDALVAAVPVLLETPARVAFETALQAPLEFGVPSCPVGLEPGCGARGWLFRVEDRLERFGVDILFNEAYFDRAERRAGHLSSTAQDWSTLLNLGGVYSGNPDAASDAYSLSPLLIASRGALRLVSRGTLTQDEDYEVDEAYVGQERGGYRYRFGMIEPTTRSLTTSGRLLGAAWGSQTDTRLDKSRIKGTELLVSVAQESFVEVFRGERLLDVQRHAPGLVSLDTTRLPPGSYRLRIRISPVSGGAATEQQRFFAKDDYLPPAGAPQFQLLVGRQDAADGDDLTLVTDLSSRLGARIVGGLSSVVDESDHGAELRLSYLFTDGVAQVSGSTSSGAGAGWSARLSMPIPGGSFNGDYTRYPAPVEQDDGSIRAAYRLASSWTFGRATALNVRHLGLRFEHGYQRETALGVSAPLWQRNRSSWRGEVELRRRAGEDYFGISVAYAGSSGGTSVGLRSDYRRDPESGELGPRLQSSLGHRLGLLHGNEVQLGADALWDPNSVSGSVSAGLNSRTGVAALQLSAQDPADTPARYFYSGSFAASVYSTPTAAGIARPAEAEGIYVVKVRGISGERAFDVLVDGQPRAVVLGGEAAAVRLAPFQPHSVSVRALDSDGLHYDATPRRAVLFPGNVQVGEWQVARVVTLFGRLVGPDQKALGRVRIDGALDPAYTDADGYFQLQTAAGTQALEVGRGERRCRIRLPDFGSDESFQALPDLTCRAEAP